MLYMEPVFTPCMTKITFGLCDLVGMVWKNIIHAAAVDIYILTQMFHADAGTLNVPSRVADPPRAIPFECLILEFGFCKPEYKIIFIFLVHIFFYIIADTD